MITYTLFAWRHFPSALAIGRGRRVHKTLLSPRFQEAIDAAAMGLSDTDSEAYLAHWHKVTVDAPLPVPEEGKAWGQALQSILTQLVGEEDPLFGASSLSGDHGFPQAPGQDAAQNALDFLVFSCEKRYPKARLAAMVHALARQG